MTARLTVDGTLCQGHARCCEVDEMLFPLDDDGYSLLRDKGGIDVEPGLLDTARAGVQICPERAIRLSAE